MNIKVDVDDLKPEEQNMQTGMLATESVRQQEVQQPGASATSAASGSVSLIHRQKIFRPLKRNSSYQLLEIISRPHHHVPVKSTIGLRSM